MFGFFQNFSLVAAVALVLIYVLLENSYQNTLQKKWAEESAQLDTLKTLISTDFGVIRSDIQTLANSLAVEQFINEPGAAKRQQVSTRFKQFAEYRRLYDQIRLIDLEANEVVRINYKFGKPVVVDEKALQKKLKRYYIQDSVQLEAGQIYVSPLDLNVENYLIEIPPKPVMRVATPLFDASGKRWGILVLNYLADRMLNRIKQHDELTGADVQLINQDGYWLYNSDDRKRWGFMYDQADARFSVTKARDWQWLLDNQTDVNPEEAANKGQVFQWVSPTEWLNANDQSIQSSIKWLILSEFSVPARLSAKYLAMDYRNLWLGILFMSAMGLLTWVYTLRSLEKSRWNSLARLSLQCMEQNRAAVMVTDRNGDIVYTNDVFTEITGYSFEQVRGRKTSVLKSGHTPLDVYQSMWRAISNGKTWQGDIQNRKADGTLFWAHLSISPIHNYQDEITHYMCVEEDVTERVAFEDKLHHIATHDALTDVENRRSIMEALKREMERALRYRHPISVILLDLDRFKYFNDEYGHLCGDELLKQFAARLAKEARQSDRVGRYGGEEFLVVLPETGAQEAGQVAHRILESARSKPYVYEAEEHKITASIGCATLTQCSDLEADMDRVLKAADEMLYLAKDRGKNQVQSIVDPEPDPVEDEDETVV